MLGCSALNISFENAPNMKLARNHWVSFENEALWKLRIVGKTKRGKMKKPKAGSEIIL